MLVGPWHIQLLGGLRATNGDWTVARFRTQKTGALLAYLALSPGRSRSREELVELFWPDSGIDRSRMSLRSALASLRRQFEPPGVPFGSVFVADAATVQLRHEAVTTDVGDFARLLQAAEVASTDAERVDTLSGAVDLYRGELLPGFYDDWAADERRRLSDAYLAALGRLVRLLAQRGDLARAVDYARSAVRTDPLSEPAHRDLIRLYVAARRPAAALQQYRELERLLAENLGVAPSEATRALVADLRHGEAPLASVAVSAVAEPALARPALVPSPTPAPPSGRPRLPLRLTRFFGREDELGRLSRLLRPDGVRLVTLTGPGGSGKTRLATETAASMREVFDGHVWFCPLADVDDPGLIAGALLDSMGLQRGAEVDPIDHIAQTLGDEPALLVIDNFEQLVGRGDAAARKAAGTIRALLERAPGLTCLITSRQPLGLDGEQWFPVYPLPVPTRPGPPERLLEFPSVQLFVDRAQLSRPDFQITPRNAESIAALCERLEGVPLAIELAAAWVQTLSPAQMLERLTRRFELLVSRRRDSAPRHASLRAAIEWSYQLLPPQLQGFFVQLSAFRGGWDAAAAATICEAQDSLDLLARLQERSLVASDEVGGAVRFWLMESLREFALEQLPAAERLALSRRHAGYYVQMAEEAEPNLVGAGQAGWLDRLDGEHDNLRAALEFLLGPHGSAEQALGLAGALWRFWWTRGHATEGRVWLDRALAGAATVPAGLRARALFGAGVLARVQGDPAKELFDASLAAYGQAADASAMIGVLSYVAGTARASGQPDRALRLYQECVALCDDIGEHGVERASALLGLGSLTYAMDEPSEAIALLEESLRLYRETGNVQGALNALGELGCLTLWQGDHGSAKRWLDEQLRQAERIRYVPGIAHALWGLGNVALCTGDNVRAVACLEECVRLSRVLGNKGVTANALHDLAEAHRRQGRGDLARAEFAEALSGFVALRIPKAVHRCLDAVARIELEQGDGERAACLLGAMDALVESGSAVLSPESAVAVQQRAAHARSLAGGAAFDAAFARGRAMTPDQVAAFVR